MRSAEYLGTAQFLGACGVMCVGMVLLFALPDASDQVVDATIGLLIALGGNLFRTAVKVGRRAKASGPAPAAVIAEELQESN